MVVEDPGGAQAKYDALGEAFAAWDGQVESAEALRIAFGSVGTLRSAPLTEAARAVTQLKRVAAKKTPAALIASFDELAPEHRAMAGALLGDTSNAPWVMDGHVDPPETAAPGVGSAADIPMVLRALEEAPPTDAIVAWVCEAFHARSRRVWIPASRAIAALARRSESLRAQIEAASRIAASGNGWAKSPGIDRWLGGDPIRRSHARRHFLHLRMALAGRGIPVDGTSTAALLRAKLPTGDASDASVVLLGLAELTRDPSIDDDAWCSALKEHLRSLADTKLLTYQHHEALRELALRLGGRPMARELVVSALVEPSLLGRHEGRLGVAIDLGIATLDNVRFVQRNSLLTAEALDGAASNGPLQLASGIALAGPAGALPWPLADEVDAVIERLRLLRASVLATRHPLWLASRAVELVALLEREQLAKVPWAALLEEAGLGDTWGMARRGGTVAEIGRADLAIRLSSLGVTEHRALLHEHVPTLSTAEALLVAAVRPEHDAASIASPNAPSSADGRLHDKFLLDQAAVATARLLDAPLPTPGASSPMPTMEDRVRLLWRLLRADPPDSFWSEVISTLRWTCRPMHHFVEALKALDAARTDSEKRTTLLQRLQSAASLAGDLGVSTLSRAFEGLPSVPPDPLAVGGLATLGRDLSAVRQRLTTIEHLLPPRSGSTQQTGLLALVAWLGHDVGALDAAARAVRESLSLLIERAFAGWLRSEECDAASDALERLRAALGPSGLAWPERRLVESALSDLRTWLTGTPGSSASGVSTEVRLREERDADIRRAMAAGDEDAVRRLLGPSVDAAGLRAGLSAQVLEEAGSFLLGQLLLDEARDLRGRVAAQRADAEIPAAAAYFAPLWTGILGGGFFTLSLAKTWNDLAFSGGAVYLIALFGALLASLGFLMVDLRKRVHRSMAKGGGIWLLVGRRVLPLYATAVAVAFGESAALLWIGQETEAAMRAASPGSVDLMSWTGLHAVALWAAVSLFGGIFLGLIAQGRGASRETPPT